MTELCACGRPLHYSDPELRTIVDGLVKTLGPTIKVAVAGRVWLVPRHYIALHGIKGWDLPRLAAQLHFEEITGRKQNGKEPSATNTSRAARR